jgi:oxygen-independent coproporphyrinogen-3 oxidase
MAGIYIHIPFCRKACHYCNFHFSTSLQYKNDFVTALLKEIDLRVDYLQQELIETIYFGGGTPSLLEEDDLHRIVAHLHRHFKIADNTEITFEANPDDITREKLISWRTNGINRLSIGVQSFFDDDLKWMNRAHSAQQSVQSILLAQEEGINNLTIDLIYGTPTLGNENWEKNFKQAVTLNIPHLSCYALTVEPKTALAKMIAQHKIGDIDSERQATQFLLLTDWATAAGYEHYEISNFAKPGMRSKHNSAYWQGKKYLGLGPSAHSFNGTARQWNIANNSLYVQSLQKILYLQKQKR